MKTTSVLSRAWRRIHPPLPRTPRESQQLLSALTSSFRRQLEAADTNQPSKSADQHVRSILENPLFRVVPPKGPALTPQERSKRLAEEPMALFDELVAAGAITGRDIAECLRYQLALIGSSSSNAKEAMKTTGAGARVVSWFWASDSASRKTLFKWRPATSAALKFMAAEDLHDTVMIWLRMISKLDIGGLDGQIPEKPGRQLFRVFLADFLEADLQYGRGIESALRSFLQVAQMCSSLGDHITPETRELMLKPGAVCLSRWISDHGSDSSIKSISPDLYERFCAVIATFPSLPFSSASVWLYHPSRPTADPLLDYLQKRVLPAESSSKLKSQKRDHVVRVWLDVLRLLLDQQRDKDAALLVPHIKRLLQQERQEESGEQPNKDEISVNSQSFWRALALT